MAAHELHGNEYPGVTPGVTLKKHRRALTRWRFNSVRKYRNADSTRCVGLFRPDASGPEVRARTAAVCRILAGEFRQSFRINIGPRGNSSAAAVRRSVPCRPALLSAPEPTSEASMIRRFNRLLLFLIPSALLFAQPETATLRGTVTDPSGKPVPDVQLVVFEAGKELSGTRSLHRRGRRLRGGAPQARILHRQDRRESFPDL